jgi:DNA-directed RNA polymerase subunit H (RpoH/RPB5)
MMEDRNVMGADEMRYMRSLGHDEIVAMAKSASIFSIDVGNVLCIIFYTSKFSMSTFKPFIEKSDAFAQTILILPEKLTAMNLKAIAERQKKADLAGSSRTVLQTFVMSELLYNITHHKLVPRHEVVAAEEEIQKIIKDYNVKNRLQLPVILRTDPVAKYFGMKPGQLAKITRVSPSAGEYVAYRCCV